MAKHWYVVHAYSNFEHKVCQSLIERIERMGMQEYFGEVLVPTETVVELRKGQKGKVRENSFRAMCLLKWK